MTIEAVAEQDPETGPFVSTPFPKAYWGKLLYGLFVLVMPVLAFWATDLFKPEWQTGEFSAYLILLLFPEAALLFFPLLAYSIVCYCLLLSDAARYSQIPLVRVGIYTGVLLAFQYSVVSGLFFFNDSTNGLSNLLLIVLWVAPVFSPKIYRFLIERWGTKNIHIVLGILVVVLFLISALIVRSPLFPLFLGLAGLTIAAPFWSFLMFLHVAIWLGKNDKPTLTLPQSLGLAAWIAGYVAAWRFNILKMYELYAALPPQPPPDCYIATAAAQGHPKLVGSWQVERTNGETMRINQQLQILKCAELALMALQPRWHKVLRILYDVVGRSMAKKIRDPFLADLAYLMLAPWSWGARFVLKRVIPEIDVISRKMYTN